MIQVNWQNNLKYTTVRIAKTELNDIDITAISW